jgi:hypothetical protein
VGGDDDPDRALMAGMRGLAATEGERCRLSSALSSHRTFTKWEYKIVASAMTEDELNKLGAEGWRAG